MVNDDVVKCPLCGGFTHIEQKELLAALQDRKIREQIEKFLADLLPATAQELTSVAAGEKQQRDFEKDVHQWNPNVPMWRRGSKE